MFGRLAMGFANVRAGTRVLMPVLVQAVRQAASTRFVFEQCPRMQGGPRQRVYRLLGAAGSDVGAGPVADIASSASASGTEQAARPRI